MTQPPPPSSGPPPPPWPGEPPATQPPPPDPSTRLDSAPAEPAATPIAGWGAGRALLGLVIVVVISTVAFGIIAGADGGQSGEIDSLGARLLAQVTLALTLVGVALFAVREANLLPGTSAWGGLGLRRPLRPAVAPTVIVYLVYIAVALAISALFSPEQEDVTRELGVDEGTLGAIAAGFLIVVAAPLSEEIFFRGFLFAGIRRSGGLIVGALISGGIFGLFHYTGSDSWPVVLQLAIFGAALAWLYERTGSIWPPIALHAFNNAIAFTLLAS